jgi:hypothetical protein
MTKENYEAGTKRGMNWTCPMNKLFLDQSNGAGVCGSAEECKTLRRSYPSHPSAKFAHL